VKRMVYYRKSTAEQRLKSGVYNEYSRIKKVKAPKGKKFEFRSKGKTIKRRTGYELV